MFLGLRALIACPHNILCVCVCVLLCVCVCVCVSVCLYRGWLRWHKGAVGAVHVMRGRGQVRHTTHRHRHTARHATYSHVCGKEAVKHVQACASASVCAFVCCSGGIHGCSGVCVCVHVYVSHSQVVSACASGDVCVWSAEGALLHTLHTGFPVTCVSGGDVFAVMGGAQGEIQVLAAMYTHTDTHTHTHGTSPQGP